MGLKCWIDGVIGSAWALTRRVAADARGNVAMLFGLSLHGCQELFALQRNAAAS